jgi:hypothetical protein
MALKRPQRLAIDASVASAAGTNGSEEQTGRKCMDMLLAVSTVRHWLLMTEKIEGEWKVEESHRATKWRRWMQSHGRIQWLRPDQLDEVAVDLECVHASSADKKLMAEDLDVLRAAMRTDKIVISLDDEVRELFAAAAVQLPAVGSVMWANPKEEADPGRWIRMGAPTQERRLLRNYVRRP